MTVIESARTALFSLISRLKTNNPANPIGAYLMQNNENSNHHTKDPVLSFFNRVIAQVSRVRGNYGAGHHLGVADGLCALPALDGTAFHAAGNQGHPGDFWCRMAVLIAIEIFHNIIIYVEDNHNQQLAVEIVLGTALMAIARKSSCSTSTKSVRVTILCDGRCDLYAVRGYYLIVIRPKAENAGCQAAAFLLEMFEPMSTLIDWFVAIPGQWEKVIATVFLIAVGMAFRICGLVIRWGEISPENGESIGLGQKHHLVSGVFHHHFSLGINDRRFSTFLAAVAGRSADRQQTADACWATFTSPLFARSKWAILLEINQLSGRVIDIDVVFLINIWRATDRKVAEFPNGLLPTTPLKTNTCTTGEYVLHLFRMPIPQEVLHDLTRSKRQPRPQPIWPPVPGSGNEGSALSQDFSRELYCLPVRSQQGVGTFPTPDQLTLVVRVAVRGYAAKSRTGRVCDTRRAPRPR